MIEEPDREGKAYNIFFELMGDPNSDEQINECFKEITGALLRLKEANYDPNHAIIAMAYAISDMIASGTLMGMGDDFPHVMLWTIDLMVNKRIKQHKGTNEESNEINDLLEFLKMVGINPKDVKVLQISQKDIMGAGLEIDDRKYPRDKQE